MTAGRSPSRTPFCGTSGTAHVLSQPIRMSVPRCCSGCSSSSTTTSPRSRSRGSGSPTRAGRTSSPIVYPSARRQDVVSSLRWTDTSRPGAISSATASPSPTCLSTRTRMSRRKPESSSSLTQRYVTGSRAWLRSRGTFRSTPDSVAPRLGTRVRERRARVAHGAGRNEPRQDRHVEDACLHGRVLLAHDTRLVGPDVEDAGAAIPGFDTADERAGADELPLLVQRRQMIQVRILNLVAPLFVDLAVLRARHEQDEGELIELHARGMLKRT